MTFTQATFHTVDISLVTAMQEDIVFKSSRYPASKVTSLRRRIDGEIGHGDVT